jgi:hypothetical protein
MRRRRLVAFGVRASRSRVEGLERTKILEDDKHLASGAKADRRLCEKIDESLGHKKEAMEV